MCKAMFIFNSCGMLCKNMNFDLFLLCYNLEMIIYLLFTGYKWLFKVIT